MSAKVFLGFGIGIILGLIFQKDILWLQPIGDLFLKLIKMIVVPVVFLSIISGISSIGDIGKLKRIGTKVVGFYIVTTVLSAIIGLIVAHIMKPGADFAVSQIVDTGEVIKPAEPMTVSQTILSMVPDNPITALATGNLMQIIVFGVFIGIAITILGDRVKNVKKVIDEANIIMFKITDMVMQVTPFGVTALVACSVGEYGLSIFNILGKFILTHYIGAFSVVLFMYVFIIKYIAKISLKDFFTKITEVWLVAFSTTSSSGTLPVSLHVTEEKFKVKDELASFTAYFCNYQYEWDCCILCCYYIICSSSIWCRTFFNATSYVYLYDYIDFYRYSWYSKQWHCIDYNVTYNNGASY